MQLGSEHVLDILQPDIAVLGVQQSGRIIAHIPPDVLGKHRIEVGRDLGPDDPRAARHHGLPTVHGVAQRHRQLVHREHTQLAIDRIEPPRFVVRPIAAFGHEWPEVDVSSLAIPRVARDGDELVLLLVQLHRLDACPLLRLLRVPNRGDPRLDLLPPPTDLKLRWAMPPRLIRPRGDEAMHACVHHLDRDILADAELAPDAREEPLHRLRLPTALASALAHIDPLADERVVATRRPLINDPCALELGVLRIWVRVLPALRLHDLLVDSALPCRLLILGQHAMPPILG